MSTHDVRRICLFVLAAAVAGSASCQLDGMLSPGSDLENAADAGGRRQDSGAQTGRIDGAPTPGGGPAGTDPLDPQVGGPIMRVGSITFVKTGVLAAFDDLRQGDAPAGWRPRAVPGVLELVAVTRNREVYIAQVSEVGLPTASSGRGVYGAFTGALGTAPAMTPRKVIGPDERVQVNDTTRYPHRTIGRLSRGCTGTLIGPRHVITAGHCIYSRETNMWHGNVDFSPGRDAARYPFGTVPWRLLITTTRFTVGHESAFDYAIMVLEQPAGDELGWLGVEPVSASAAPDLPIRIMGYPADLTPKYHQWYSDCPIDSVEANRLQYRCDTFGGMSGSALRHRDPNNPTGFVVIRGIHTAGTTRANQGVFLDAERYRLVAEVLNLGRS